MTRFILIALFSVSFLCSSSSQQTVGLFFNDSTSYNGYTLFAPSASRTTYLINNCGEVINTWTSTYTPGASVYLLENGNLLRTARINGSFNGGGAGGRLELFSWEGDLLWRYNYAADTVHQHHDIQPLPNGNILILAWELRTPEEAIAAGRNPVTTPSVGIWSEQVVEVEMIGENEINIVWEWHLWDHLVQDFDTSKVNYGIIADHPERLDINYTGGTGGPVGNPDWVHLNSIDHNPELDQIILSSRTTNEIYVIDHSTTTEEAAGSTGGHAGKGGDFLYRWGNPAVYDRGLPSDQKFYGQHNATWVPPGYPDAGKIMVFNNGQGRPGGNYSTVDVLAPPLNADGSYYLEENQPFGPNELFWEYMADPPTDFYSSRISGAQRLPNGNTLVCEGAEGHFFEIDYEGAIVWDYVSPISGNNPVPQGSNPSQNDVFRTLRYGPDYGAFIDKDLTPGSPVELDPMDTGCQIFGGETTSVNEGMSNQVKVLTNPFQDRILLQNDAGLTLGIEIIDISGKRLFYSTTKNNYLEIDTAFWSKGLYVLRIYDKGMNPHFTQKIIKL